MSKSFAVIGIGRFGTSVALTLSLMGHEVLAVDTSAAAIDSIADRVTHAIVADATDERVLRRIGIAEFDAVVISVAADIRASILTAMLSKELGAKRVVAKAADDLHAKLLIKAGADQVVQPERDSGVRLARSIAVDSVLDYFALTDDVSINELRLPYSWAGKSLVQLGIRTRYGVSVIAIKRGEKMIVAIDPNSALEQGDVLVLLGSNHELEKLASID
ncbi:MAG: TrkA family potassium uptake protein [Eubacteriales bacterium]|jgi:trk system potassium uptake protein TrkA|nr:TrkA family potassium uptake protein [Eubacteriales bacterium]MCI6979487.1 TrkA family potassium uptake protein [Clostridiales bacterium]MDD6721753.1 TrkA family potassium uptake protein [Clostridiales bacterium]MDY5694354.1 TrkA family potassium uptake protein [Eubacteriales bacterium]HZK45725.1 TrkA family potassium uptake protein [Clostridia bacterium]